MIEPETLIDGRYRVIARIGSGGMADVYRAQDMLLGREVAVKILHHHFAEDQEFVERFRREASSAAALSHPNIVAIFDRGEWNGTYYIAMEYVAGRTLKTIVREQGALDPAAAIDVVIQILRAARSAHRRGVIHRDLKPHNVIIDEEGRARVTDFGIARAGASDMTLTGSIMGTAQYLSPEQAQGLAVSATSDLYSIGVILYELLTGVVPFEGETAVAIAYKQVAAEPYPPSMINPALPASLDAVVLRALAKDPTQRYADADELIAALEAERRALPAFSGAAATTVLASQVHEPHTAVAPAAGAAAGGLLLAPPAGFEPNGPAPAEPDAEDGRRRALWWTLGLLALVAVAVAVLLLTRSGSSVTVPPVTGQREAQALGTLRGAGLDPAVAHGPSASVPGGVVMSQSPAAGTVVGKHAHVTIDVSSGPASAALPDLTGLPVAKAEARLHQQHYKTARKAQASKTVEAGKVIGTEPAAETVVREGGLVTLLVSSGPAAVRVPDLAGDSLQAAEAALAGAELALGNVSKQTSATQPAGTVLSQTPAPGEEARAGSKVELVLAKAPKEVEVIKVEEAAEAAAANALRRAGFKVRKQTRETPEASQVGVVLEQSPAPGSHARKGSTVTIVVGKQAQPTPTTTTSTTSTTSAGGPPAAVAPAAE